MVNSDDSVPAKKDCLFIVVFEFEKDKRRREASGSHPNRLFFSRPSPFFILLAIPFALASVDRLTLTRLLLHLEN